MYNNEYLNRLSPNELDSLFEKFVLRYLEFSKSKFSKLISNTRDKKTANEYFVAANLFFVALERHDFEKSVIAEFENNYILGGSIRKTLDKVSELHEFHSLQDATDTQLIFETINEYYKLLGIFNTILLRRRTKINKEGEILEQIEYDYDLNIRYLKKLRNVEEGWDGINITNNSNTNEFEYCIFEHVKKSQAGPPRPKKSFLYSGSVYLDNSNNTTFKDCVFRNNTVYHSGGGLFFWDSKANISNCEFNNNTAITRKAGAVFIKKIGSDNHSISDCIFSNNTANTAGGAVAINGVGNISITGCDFDQNKIYTSVDGMSPTKKGGGAMAITVSLMAVSSVYATVSDCNFSNNEAIYDGYYSNGGGIFAIEDYSVLTLDLEISNSTFSSNKSDGNGGGICLNNLNDDVHIYNNFIQDNTALDNGGGIYMWYLDNNSVFYNNLITGNEAGDYGGGIYLDESSPKIYNCTVSDNTASSGDGVYSAYTANPVFINDIIYPDEVIIDGFAPKDWTTMFLNCDIDTWYSPFNNYYGNISDDPQFVTYGGFDYLPRNTAPVSPCIGAGQTIPSFTQPTFDLRGTPYSRTVSQIDMGTFEHPGNQSYKIAKHDSNINELSSDRIVIYPNPIESYFNILMHSEVEGNVNINLINSLGKTVYSSEFFLNEGDNFLQVERNQLPTGIYYLKLNSASFDSKFVKILFE